jgi:hypothetical protein
MVIFAKETCYCDRKEDRLQCASGLQSAVVGANLTSFFYFYRCTVHFEDSLIITYQQMH